MTRTKKLRVLRDVYAVIPNANCKGLCTDACSTVPVFDIELRQLEEVAGRSLPTMTLPGDAVALGTDVGATCPLLVMNRCSVYEHRPLICRAFGAVVGMKCPFGCEPDRVMSTDEMQRHVTTVGAL